jgi:hypothetical protein
MKGLRFTIRRVAAVQRRARPIRSASASAVSSSGCFAAFRVGSVAVASDEVIDSFRRRGSANSN